jgi:phage shock protein C
MIAGVCGGLAEYFDIDPLIPRLIFIVLLLPGGLPGFIPYIILWIVVPEKGKAKHGKEE